MQFTLGLIAEGELEEHTNRYAPIAVIQVSSSFEIVGNYC
ncbi:hypothetical protein Hbal_1206 [Hirschia baltica ATCC 49814]|uniref:Uncharacterized protein n=1 Tax=Hirschia baltica (strain ATCC 49814 / DSM 5838 / IFAM 1418) TaxID=582402 RepID=C6XI72_HIRBI|nr:hypothetical protein Hbal_1206 [Hirschia baltica ATCC 49814]